MRGARDFLTFQAGWWAAFAWYQHAYWVFAVCALFAVIADAIDARVELRGRRP